MLRRKRQCIEGKTTQNILPVIFITVQQAGNENPQTYWVGVVILIKDQILVIHLQGNIKQLEERIGNQAMRAKYSVAVKDSKSTNNCHKNHFEA